MRKRQTDRQTLRQKASGVGSRREAQRSYYSEFTKRRGYRVQLEKEVGMGLSRQTRRQHSWYKAGPWRQVWLFLVGAVSAGEQFSGHQHPGRGSQGGHFLYTLSLYSLWPKEGSAMPVSLTSGKKVVPSLQIWDSVVWDMVGRCHLRHSLRTALTEVSPLPTHKDCFSPLWPYLTDLESGSVHLRNHPWSPL